MNATVPIYIEYATLGAVVGITLLFTGLFFMTLAICNCKSTPKDQSKERPKAVKWIRFFFEEILIGLFTLAFTIYAGYQLETNNWGVLNIFSLRISFWIFSSLKFILMILLLLGHKMVGNVILPFRLLLMRGGYLPPNWLELMGFWIFVPCLLVDGCFLNAEFILGNVGDLFPYDGADTIIFLKEIVKYLLQDYWSDKKYKYKILPIFYDWLILIYTVYLSFTFILFHLQSLFIRKEMRFTREMIFVIISVLLHTFLCRITSMTRQGIKSIVCSNTLNLAPNARIQAANFYTIWFYHHPASRFFNVIAFLSCFALYVFVTYPTLYFLVETRNIRETDIRLSILSGGLKGVFIVTGLLTVFFLWNWIYAVAKRCGGSGLCKPKPPFDCSTYAKEMNKLLDEHNATWRMNELMQCD